MWKKMSDSLERFFKSTVGYTYHYDRINGTKTVIPVRKVDKNVLRFVIALFGVPLMVIIMVLIMSTLR